MKFTAIFLLIACLQVSANGYSQKITLSQSDVPLKKVFREIENQTGYQFFYKDKLLRHTENISINISNASIEDVLNECLKNQPLTYTVVDKIIVIKKEKKYEAPRIVAKVPSPVVIKGVIKDENGTPLAGVSIVVRGTQKGTSTGTDGGFTIDANPGDVLDISIVGYKKRSITVGNDDNLNIQLEVDVVVNSEIVVVGYGTQKKTNATGSVVQIDNKILEDRPMSRLSQGLQGAVANLNITTTYGGGAPNATQSFNIRGYTGFGSTAGPLIVIDGVQGGDINAVNPNDVETVTVVKDAAASAIYGSSAPYGVLIITTKKGRSGKPVITYNNNITINTPIGMPKMLNSLDYAQIYSEAYINAGGTAYSFFSQDAIQRMKDYQAGIITTETQAAPAPADYYLSWGAANANNDWFRIFYKNTQVLQQHNLSVSGGSDRTKYFIGLGYNDRPGMLRYGKDIYRRYNIRANLSSKATDWFEMNLRTSYSKETYDAPWAGGDRTGGNWMHQIARKHPNIPLYLPDGKTFSEVSDIPLMLDGGRHLESWDKPQITGEIILSPVKGLSATVNYTYDVNIWNNSDHLKTVYVPVPSGTQRPIDYTYPNRFSRNNGFQYHHVLNAFASYTHSLKQHNFKLLGGYVRELNDNTSLSAGNSQLYTDNIPSINTSYGANPFASDGKAQLATEGFFGRFNYDFNGKYLLEVVGRYDGTSRFLQANRWGFYPGISAGWNIAQEGFWSAANLDRYVNTLKLRGSYGSLGDQVSALGGNWYPFYPSLGTTAPTSTNWYFSGGREPRTTMPGLVNPDITWVTTTTLDFGIDATAMAGRLSVTFDWYKRSAKDYLGPSRNLPAVLGAGVPQENVSAIETKGFELTLGWKDRIGQFTYNLRGALSNYKGVVKKYPNSQKLISDWYDGEVMGSIYGFETIGYFTGDAEVAKSADQSYIYSKWGPGDIRYADLNGDGKINIGTNTLSDMGDRRVIGNSTPQYQYSLFGDFSWKNFDASIFIQGVGKRQVFFGSGTNYFWGIVGSEWQSSPFTVHNDRWTPSNPDGYFPKYYMSGENGKNMVTQTRYLQNAAYARLKTIQLGYTLPSHLFSKMGVQKIKLFALVENVATISPLKKHSMIDPETFFSDMKIYPMQRGYSFGVNITFN